MRSYLSWGLWAAALLSLLSAGCLAGNDADSGGLSDGGATVDGTDSTGGADAGETGSESSVWPGSEGLTWRFDPDERKLTPPAKSAQGYVVVGGWSGYVYAVDSAGNLQWEYDAGAQMTGAPTIASGTVYVGTYGSKILALDAADGTKQWSFETDGIVDASIAAPGEGTIYAVTQTGTLYAVSASGEEQWTYSLPGEPSTPVSVVDRADGERTLLVGTFQRDILCVTPGQEVSATHTEIQGSPITSILPADDGSAIFGAANGRVFGLDSECTVEWKNNPSWTNWSGGVWAEDGSVVFGMLDQDLYRYATDGERKWKKGNPMPASLFASPVALSDGRLLGSAKSLFTVTLDGEVERLSLYDFFGAPVLVDDGDAVVDVSERGIVARFELASPVEPASTGWFAHHADFQRTSTLKVQ